MSSRIRPYVQALKGLEQFLSHDYQVFDLKTNYQLAMHYVQNGSFAAGIAIGPEATRLLYSNASSSRIPVKFAIMTLDISKMIGQENICGIDLRIPIEQQIKLIASYLGPGKRIAILYNQHENQEIVDSAMKCATRYEMEILPLEVKHPSDIMSKFSHVLPKIDVVLFIPDSIVISEKIVKHIIKKALISGVASVGFNSFFVEIGALLSFVIDYEQIGRQTALFVERALVDGDCTLHRPEFKVMWNKKALEMLKRIDADRWNSLHIKEDLK